MVTRVRNKGCTPCLSEEGELIKAIAPYADIDPTQGPPWYKGMSPWDRLFYHHTLSSVRRHAFFRPFPDLITKEELDFVLDSSYCHSDEIFPDTVDVYLQKETIGAASWRRLRNSREIMPDLHAVGEDSVRTDRYNKYHPVLIGGVSERKHPSNIKLMNSSHHSPQTNAGYTRQPDDGNVFQY